MRKACGSFDFLEFKIIKTRRIEANEKTFNFQKPKRTVACTVSSSPKMVKCVAPGCKSGYDSNRDDDKKEGISLFRFPKDPGILQMWLRAIPRDQWEPSQNSRVCSRHFNDSDYVQASTDTNTSRKRKNPDGDLVLRRLKDDAVPSIFPNLPSYLTRAAPPARSEAATSLSRQAKVQERLKVQEDAFLAKDMISSLDQLREKRHELTVPKGTDFIDRGNAIIFLSFNDQLRPPTVQYHMHINDRLQVEMSAGGQSISRDNIKHLISGGIRVQTLSSVSNILSFLKATAERCKDDPREIVSQAAESLGKISLGSEELDRKLGFLCEQLGLVISTKNHRHYSPGLLASALLWKTTSTALYKHLLADSLLTLPSISHLQRLSKAFSAETGISASALSYLSLRIKDLSEKERIVTMMLDEIYSAKRVEYSGGKVYGLQEDGSTSKTVLAFMVKSVAGPFSDVVALFPVTSLDSSALDTMFKKVLPALTDLGFKVLVT